VTVARPYAYWVRNDSYANAFTANDNDVYNRCQAVRSVEDQLVRTYLHTSIHISTSTTSPPPKDWPYALNFLAVAGYSPSPTSTMQTAQSGDVGVLCTARVVFTGLWPIASPGVNIGTWEQQRTESAKVYQSAPADNSDYPCVQSGVNVLDPGDILFPPATYHYSVVIRQFLETLWASSVPPV
jgi:hypothetical protein